jgi:hypothetical protein
MLLEAKVDEALEYWRREFVLKGHRNDLLRMMIENNQIVVNMGLLNFLFTKPPDEADLFLRTVSIAALRPHFGMDPETFAQDLSDASKSQIWREVAGLVVAQIDNVLPKAEGV